MVCRRLATKREHKTSTTAAKIGDDKGQRNSRKHERWDSWQQRSAIIQELNKLVNHLKPWIKDALWTLLLVRFNHPGSRQGERGSERESRPAGRHCGRVRLCYKDGMWKKNEFKICTADTEPKSACVWPARPPVSSQTHWKQIIWSRFCFCFGFF